MKWICQEAGWYTSEVGGLCKEDDGCWYFYPLKKLYIGNYGPFKTLKEAKEAVKWER